MLSHHRRIQAIGLAFFLPLLLLSLGLLFVHPLFGNSATAVRYVSGTGTCGGMLPCYTTIQSALDAAGNGDLIKVARGTYTSSGFQVVYINKEITLTGGYAEDNWDASLSETNPTIIDAENVERRRAVYIDGTAEPTITVSGFTIQRGCAHNANGSNVYVVSGTVNLSDNRIEDTAPYCSANGGGVYIENGTVTLAENTIRHNVAQQGGGIYIKRGDVTLVRNQLVANSENGGGFGGGGYGPELDGTIRLISNTIAMNSAGRGGGLSIRNSPEQVIIVGNQLLYNEAHSGGGLEIAVSSSSEVLLDRNYFIGNAATYGSGIYIYSGDVFVRNSIIADNPAIWEGVYVSGGKLTAENVTLAKNGKYALTTNSSQYGDGTALLTNTIVVSHVLGGFAGPNITAAHTLFSGNGTKCTSGATCDYSYEGNPRFFDPQNGDYHIGPGSGAVDMGVDTGILIDIDNEERPLRSAYDLGADEQPPPPTASFEHTGPVWIGQPVSFTNKTVSRGDVWYRWNFDDGAISPTTQASHTYSEPGVYTVVLSATSYGGTHTATGILDVYGPEFTSSSPDWLGESTIFSNTSYASSTTTYLWTFSDGGTAFDQNPTHQYRTPGLYTVTLSASDERGGATATGSVIVYSPPTANFWANPRTGIGSLSVAFTNTTVTEPALDPSLTYLWDFGDGGDSSDVANPFHIYRQPGQYTVTLTATNAAGIAEVTKIDYITVYEPAVAAFTGSPTSGSIPLTVSFSNLSSGDYDTCNWSFGDDNTSTDCSNPQHTYTSPGIYTVALTVSGLGETDSESKTDYIVVDDTVGDDAYNMYLPSITSVP